MKCTTHFLKWFLSHSVRNLWFRNLAVWETLKHRYKHSSDLHFMHWNLVVVQIWQVAHMRHCRHNPATVQCVMCHIWSSIFWFSSWDGLWVSLFCTCFKQILYQKNYKIFCGLFCFYGDLDTMSCLYLLNVFGIITWINL